MHEDQYVYIEAVRFYEALRNMCRTTQDQTTRMDCLLRIGEAFQAFKLYDQGTVSILSII